MPINGTGAIWQEKRAIAGYSVYFHHASPSRPSGQTCAGWYVGLAARRPAPGPQTSRIYESCTILRQRLPRWPSVQRIGMAGKAAPDVRFSLSLRRYRWLRSTSPSHASSLRGRTRSSRKCQLLPNFIQITGRWGGSGKNGILEHVRSHDTIAPFQAGRGTLKNEQPEQTVRRMAHSASCHPRPDD